MAFAQSPNYQGIIYVTPAGAGTQSGDSWANAIPSISDAQTLAQEYNAVVWVAAGIYYGNPLNSGSNAFYLKEGVNVFGSFEGNEPDNYDLNLRDFVANASILDGNSEHRVLYQSADFTIPTTWDGFTITNGHLFSDSYPYSDRYKGGGVYLRLNGILKNCIVTNNRSDWCLDDYGGGIYADHATIENCHISCNLAHNAGGIYALYATINNCQIYNNVASYYGGGIYADNSTVTNCLIYNNSCHNHGGGVAARNNSIVSECQIHHNTGSSSGSANGSGGGVYADNNTLITFCDISYNMNLIGNGGGVSAIEHSIVSYCIIHHNQIPQVQYNNLNPGGGGIYITDSSLVSNCLVYNNSINTQRESYGGGISSGLYSSVINSTVVKNSINSSYSDYCRGGGVTSNGNNSIVNCIISGNEINGLSNNLGSYSVNTSICSYSAVEGGFDGDHIIDIGGIAVFVNPSLLAGSDDTTSNIDWHLRTSIPCINAGDNFVVSDSIDLDGNARIFQDTVDLGCYEWNGSITGILVNHNSTAAMTVYPNPTNGIINAQCIMHNAQVGTMEFQVYDAFGRLLRSTNGVETFHETSLQTDEHGSSTQTAQIDLSHYAAGVYFVKVVADDNVIAVRKVIRN